MDLRTDGQGFREDENRYGRLDEHSGIGRVQDYKVLLQDGFRYEGDKSGGSGYVPLPKFYTFKSREERERILYKNFIQVGQDVKDMIADVLNKRGAK